METSIKSSAGRKGGEVGLLFGLVALTFILWNTPISYPLKLLVVFFHELSHAIVSEATGGEVKEFVVNHMQGGHVLCIGGNRFLVLNAGYLGSLLWGALVYSLSVATSKDRVVMGALGVLMLAVPLRFGANGFGLIYSVIMGLVMLAVAFRFGHRVSDFVLRLIGLTSMLYAVADILLDIFASTSGQSDAAMLAGEFGGTTWLWGGLWVLISLGVIVQTVRWSLNRQ